MFLVEQLNENFEYQPIGCADSFSNALVMLKGKSGRIQTETRFIIIARG